MMVSLSVKVEYDWNFFWGIAGPERHRLFEILLDAAGEELLRGAQRRTNVVTGRLRGAWSKRWIGGTEPAIAIENDVEYAVYQEFGTEHMQARRMAQRTIEEDTEAAVRAAAAALREYAAAYRVRID